MVAMIETGWENKTVVELGLGLKNVFELYKLDYLRQSSLYA